MKFKKIISMVLIFALVLSNMVFAGTNPINTTIENKEILGKIIGNNFKKFEPKQLTSSHLDYDGAVNPSTNMADRLNLYKDSDTVRVIVELEGDSVVRHAINQKTSLTKLTEAQIEDVKADLEVVQAETEKAIESSNLDVEIRHEFKTALNGFSAEVAKKDLDKLSTMPNVKKVTIVNIYERNMDKAVAHTNAQKVWAAIEDGGLNMKGEGTLIAIIDSGIDYRHKDFVLGATGQANMALTKAKVDELIAGGTVGKYYTDKVPMGWNWADNNDQVIDLGDGASMHGQHVGGISASNGELKGVAPEAQILAEKVFSNNQETGAFADDIVAAINHAVELNADVLNMSLGSTAGFVLADDPEQKAINDAVKAGVIAVVSAGNSAYMSVGYDYPMAAHPDTGVVGSPGVATDSFQIAAANNTLVLFQHTVTAPGVTDLPTIVGYGKDSWSSLAGQTLQLVAVGGSKLGHPADYEGIDVKGKIALVKRGELSFYQKTINAAEKGAIGIIVYDHGLATFHKDQGGVIPFMHVQKTPGDALAAAVAKAGNNLSITVAQKSSSIDPSTGRPTSFSSWGPTADLQFKPEIMAPGGNINSLANNDQYQYMSGTSMSAPHVAGGMALIAQALKAKVASGELNMTENSKTFVDHAKTIAMNTAVPSFNQYGYEYQPRLQGAGMMKIDKAITTPVYITDANGKAGVSLKEIGNATTFALTLTNMSNADQTYKINPTVATDYIFSDGYNSQISVYMDETNYDADHVATMTNNTADNTITVPAGQTATVNMTLNVAKAPRNIFVEGFIYFEPVNANVPTLNVPYYGFYGDWSEPSIIDPVEGEQNSYFGYTGLLSEILGELYYTDAISPNGDGILDEVTPIVSLLRNAKDFVVNVKDSSGTIVRTVASEKDLRKVHDLDDGKAPYKFSTDWKWDGKLMNNLTKALTVAKDGKYTIELKTRIDYPNAKWQTTNLPIMVDATAPKFALTTTSGTSATGKVNLEWTANEAGVGLDLMVIDIYEINAATGLKTGNYKTAYVYDVAATSKEITLPYKTNAIQLYGFDKVLNYGETGTITITNDAFKHEGAPKVVIESPENVSILDSRTTTVKGYIDAPHVYDGVLKINGQDVAVAADNSFTTFVTFTKDGWNHLNVEAYYTDNYDPANPATEENRTAFAYKYIIDTTTPDVSVAIDDSLKGFVLNGQKYLTLSGSVYDETSIGYMFKINGDTYANIGYDDMTTVNEPFTYTVPVAADTKTLFQVTDAAGNAKDKTVAASVYTNGLTISDGIDSADVVFTDLGTNYAGPSIDAIAPLASEVVHTDNVDVVVTASSIAGIKEVYINDRQATLVDGKYVLNIPVVDGENPVTVRAVDAIGMTKETQTTIAASLNGPSITMTMPLLTTSENKIKVTGTVKDIHGVETVTVNGVTATLDQGTGAFEHTISLVPGPNAVTVEATDKTGEKSVKTIEVLYHPLPTIDSITPAVDNVINADNVDVVVAATAPLGIKDVFINGAQAALVDGKYVLNIKLVEGENPVIVKVVDVVGMSAEIATIVKANTFGPTIAITMPYLTTSADTIKVTGEAKDTNGVKAVTVNGEAATLNESTGTFEHIINLTAGANAVTIEATDAYGKQSVQTISVLKVDTELNVAVNTQAPDTVRYNVPVELTAETDRPVDWTVTVKDVNGNQVAQLQGTGLSFGKSWAPEKQMASGTYTVEYQAKDGEDIVVATSNFTVYNYDVKITGLAKADATGTEKVIFKAGSTVDVKATVKAITDTTKGLVLVKVQGPNASTVAYRYVSDVEIKTEGTITNFGFSLSTTALKGTYKIEAYVWDNITNAGALCPAVETTFVVE